MILNFIIEHNALDIERSRNAQNIVLIKLI